MVVESKFQNMSFQERSVVYQSDSNKLRNLLSAKFIANDLELNNNKFKKDKRNKSFDIKPDYWENKIYRCQNRLKRSNSNDNNEYFNLNNKSS